MKKAAFLLMINLFLFGIAYGEPVRIAYLQSDIHHLPCWVALDKGFFEAEGVKVEVAGIFKAGPELMSAFAAGALDMGYVGVAPATTAVANKTAKVVVLAQVNTEGSALVVKKSWARASAGARARTTTRHVSRRVFDILVISDDGTEGLRLRA